MSLLYSFSLGYLIHSPPLSPKIAARFHPRASAHAFDFADLASPAIPGVPDLGVSSRNHRTAPVHLEARIPDHRAHGPSSTYRGLSN
jgi:hypothetical protein